MLINILIGWVLIGITVTIQAHGTSFWLNHIKKKYFSLSEIAFDRKSVRLLITTSLFLLLLHLIQSGLWAFTYYILPSITEFETFEKAMYFSLVTFTTLGYGDITISSDHRLLAGFEAINGILLIGWSTAFSFSVLQYIWKQGFTKNKKS